MKSWQERFWQKVNKDGPIPANRPELGPCWIWLGCLDHGYGVFSFQSKKVRAHSFSYKQFVGAMPAGLVPDHLCHRRDCVNYKHMEPVTIRENVLRGEGITAKLASQTVCKLGHALSEDNVYIWNRMRHCRKCGALRQRSFRANHKPT